MAAENEIRYYCSSSMSLPNSCAQSVISQGQSPPPSPFYQPPPPSPYYQYNPTNYNPYINNPPYQPNFNHLCQPTNHYLHYYPPPPYTQPLRNHQPPPNFHHQQPYHQPPSSYGDPFDYNHQQSVLPPSYDLNSLDPPPPPYLYSSHSIQQTNNPTTYTPPFSHDFQTQQLYNNNQVSPPLTYYFASPPSHAPFYSQPPREEYPYGNVKISAGKDLVQKAKYEHKEELQNYALQVFDTLTECRDAYIEIEIFHSECDDHVWENGFRVKEGKQVQLEYTEALHANGSINAQGEGTSKKLVKEFLERQFEGNYRNGPEPIKQDEEEKLCLRKQLKEDMAMGDMIPEAQNPAEMKGKYDYDIEEDTTLMDPTLLSHSLPSHLGFDPGKMNEMRILMFAGEDEGYEEPNGMSSHHLSTGSLGSILMVQQGKGPSLKPTKVERVKLELKRETSVTRSHSRNIVDVTLFMGRSFRLGWGSNGALAHRGALDGSNDPMKVLSFVIHPEKVAIDKVSGDESRKIRDELTDFGFDSPLNLQQEIDHETKEVGVGSVKSKLQKLICNFVTLTDICRSYIGIIKRQLEVPGLRVELMYQVLVWELLKVLPVLRIDWYMAVLDVARTIKSSRNQGAQAAFALSSSCRWCLTGTPLQNNLEDCCSLLCFLYVDPWCNWAWWHRLIQWPYENDDPHLNINFQMKVKIINLEKGGGGGDLYWGWVHYLNLREFRHLEEGMKIYAWRKGILRNIHTHRVMVLIGEIGSGKSTQLVQFFADSEVAGNDFIIYTQPRKLAASSLAHRVYLAVAVLRILVLDVANMEDFDLFDARRSMAIVIESRNLIQLGTVTQDSDELTKDGLALVRLCIELKLDKIILKCFDHHGKEGLVPVVAMANSSSIFCRIGTEGDKKKSNRLKEQFCHPDGDLFILLSVYEECESVPQENKFPLTTDFSIYACGDADCIKVCDILEWLPTSKLDDMFWKLVLLLGETYLALDEAYKDEGQSLQAFKVVELTCLVYRSRPQHLEAYKCMVSFLKVSDECQKFLCRKIHQCWDPGGVHVLDDTKPKVEGSKWAVMQLAGC